MRTRPFVLAFALASACGGEKPDVGSSASKAERDTAASHPEPHLDEPMPDEARTVYEQVIASQKAGYEGLDVEAYMAMWHPQGRLIMSLALFSADDYVVMTRAQIEATRRVRFCRAATPYEMRFELLDAQMNEGDLLLDLQSVGLKGKETVIERYRMRKHDGVWKIVENRYTVQRVGSDQGILELNADHYAKIRSDIARTSDADPLASFNLATNALLWVEAAEFGASALNASPALGDDKAFLDAYASSLLFTGDALAAVKAYEGKLAMSDADAQALIDGYCAQAPSKVP